MKDKFNNGIFTDRLRPLLTSWTWTLPFTLYILKRFNELKKECLAAGCKLRQLK